MILFQRLTHGSISGKTLSLPRPKILVLLCEKNTSYLSMEHVILEAYSYHPKLWKL